MTEQEWMTSTDPITMLWFLQEKTSDRKLRLAACAYCRSVWQFMGKASQKAVLLGEQMADAPVNENKRHAVVRTAIEAVCRFKETAGDFFMAADMAYRVPCNDGWYAVQWTIGNWSNLTCGVQIVREVFGNPFHGTSTINPSTLSWNDATIPKLAQVIYDDRRFEDMPILADALMDAGCHDQEILNHCRSAGPHAKGCWVLDALLGKE